MFIDLSSLYCPYYAISHVYTLTRVCACGSFPFLRYPYEPFGLTPGLDLRVVHPQGSSWTSRRCLRTRTRRAEAGGTEYSGAAIIYSVIEQIVRGTESVRE